jgi:hypothetical protein
MMHSIRAWKYNLILLAVLTTVNPSLLQAQSGTSSALSGEVTDPSGAAVPNAKVTATDVNTKATRTGPTDAGGHFLFSQINPGTYQVTVEASGFAALKSEPTAVGVGRTVALNFSLRVQSNNQTVEVTAQEGLLSLDNPNTTTTIDAKQIRNLPNPGQDLTYLAQFAQGALMNTAGSSNDAKAAGGYGNVEFNGLPATSNGYILDGYDTNDPWLGLNIGLSTNLVIGLDAVQEATVNTNSFSVDQGRYAVAQVNYFTKSGTNAFHGDVYEIWNGSLFNAENYFLHANDSPGDIAKKPCSTVNEFGVSVGGPIRKDKLFFFGHFEGIRIALPLVSQITLPSTAYQQYVLGQLATGGSDPVTGTNLPAQPAEIPFYRNMFSLLPTASGSPVSVNACPLDGNGNLLPAPPSGTVSNGAGCAVQRQQSLTNSDSENLIVVKIDHTISPKDSVWYRFQQDTGLQAAYTDPINPIFNGYQTPGEADAAERNRSTEHSIGSPPPPHDETAETERDQASSRKQANKLIGDSEELSFMRGNSGADHPIEPRFGMEIGALEGGSCCWIENKIDAQRPVLRIGFGSPIFSQAHRRRDQDRISESKRGDYCNHLVQRPIGVRGASHIVGMMTMRGMFGGTHPRHVVHLHPWHVRHIASGTSGAGGEFFRGAGCPVLMNGMAVG